MKKYMPLCALALAAAPLSAEPAQELFTNMAGVTMQPIGEYRADAYVFIHGVGEMAAPFLQNCKDEERRKQVESIGQIALVAETGSAERFHAFLSMVMRLQQLSRTKEACKAWLLYAKPEHREMIQNTFETALAPKAAELKSLAEKVKLAPMYAVLAAAPGKEGDFDSLYQAIAAGLAAHAAKPESQEAGIKAVEVGGYTGLEIPRSTMFCKNGCTQLPLPKDVLNPLSEGSIYVLVKKDGAAIRLTLCSDLAQAEPADATPTESSVSTREILTAAAARREDQSQNAGMRGMAYFSPAFAQAYVDAGQQNNYDLLLGIAAEVCSKMAAEDAANAPVFTGAANGLNKMVRAFFPPAPSVVKPSFAQIFQHEDTLEMILACDAMGMHYEQGELRTAALADAPEVALYAESTPLTFPNNLAELPSLSDCLNIAKAITLTMTEEVQDDMSPNLLLAESIIPKLTSLGQAFRTVFSGLDAQSSLVVSRESAVPNPMMPQTAATPQIAVAMATGVQNRAALGEGWQRIVELIQQESTELGMPPNMLTSFIVPRAAGQNAAMNYTLFLPMLPLVQPQLTVTDKSFVLSTHTGLNNKMVAQENTPHVPFRGAAVRVNFATLGQMIQDNTSGSPTNVFVGNSPLQQLFVGKTGSVSATLVDQDGTLILRWKMKK